MGKNKARTKRGTKYDKKSEKLLREGEGNKQEILNVVTDYTNRKERGGIEPHQIADIVGTSRQAVQGHLKSLVRERKVEKRKERGHRREYRVTDSYQVSKEWKARIMRPMAKKMLYPIWLTPKVTGSTTPTSIYGLTEPEHKFYEKMCSRDATISNKFCQTKFGRGERNEAYTFEFVNRVGTFITYIFIESLKALSEREMSSDHADANSQTDISKTIIDKGVDLNGIFRDFQLLCQFLKADPNEMSRALGNVYPCAKMLEKYWSDRVQLSERTKGAYKQKS